MENLQNVARGNAKNTEDFYVEIKDGHGNPIRQLNFDNPNVCQRSGLIELIPMKERKGFENRVGFRRVTDRETKASIGIPERINYQTKEWEYRLITLIGRRVYDLTNDSDAKEWACIKYSPYLEGSPNQDRNAAPIYKVYDKEKIAIENVQRTRTKRRAEQIADQLQGEDLNDMMRACGMGITGMSEVMKLNAITQFAESEPETFLKHWESPTRKEAFLLKQAVDFDIVQSDLSVGFVYRTTHLGLNEQEAVSYLKAHPNISTALDTLIMQKKSETTKSNTVKVVQNSSTKDAEIQAANDEIAKLKAELKAQANKTIAVESNSKEDGESPNPTFDTLKARAKELGVKGWHLMKEDKLEKAIQEAEAKK